MNASQGLRTWRIRNIGYDANQRDADWYNVTAEDWETAVAMALDLDRERVSFTQPIMPRSSIHAAYVPSATGGHTKIGCVQVG